MMLTACTVFNVRSSIPWKVKRCSVVQRHPCCDASHPCSPRLAVRMSAFPTPAERNRQLARRLREALAAVGAPPTAYDHIKRTAAAYRAGRLDAQALHHEFFSMLGASGEAEDLYRVMAELLPTAQQYMPLVDAFDAARSSDGSSAQQQAGDTEQRLGGSPGDAGSIPLSGTSEKQQVQQQQGQGVDRVAAGQGAERSAGQAQANAPRRGASGGGVSAAGAAAELVLTEGTHPNSYSARPAKPLPAAKRARSSSGTPETAGAEASSNAGARRLGGVVVWLRQDLRLADNPALCAAAADAAAAEDVVTLVYVHSPESDGDDVATGRSWRPGAASLLWLQGALRCLDADLRARYGPGAGIVYRHGPYAQALLEVAAGVGAGRVYYSRRYQPAMKSSDEAVQAQLEAAGLAVRSFAGYLLHEPQDVRLDMGSWAGHFGTLMPFYRACEALGGPSALLPPPASLPVADHSPADRCGGVALEDVGLSAMPRRRDGSVIDWGAPIRAAWDFSEQAAVSLLDRFIAVGASAASNGACSSRHPMPEGLARYESDRGFADGRCVSKLSPYLHFGQISPRTIMHRLSKARCKQVSKTFWRRLVWRDLAYWQLHHWPAMAAEPIREHYRAQEWWSSPAALRAWQRGATGFPLVDAAMRQLWATGWMQQNARMAAACLLTEYLNIHWVEGARWFHDTLVDGDLAINSMMWQNAGKSGLDQWNFTVLPTSKAQDPDGSYIRRWVPELARLPAKYLHEPWKAPPATLAAAGVVLGSTYPNRITSRDMQELHEENSAAVRAARLAGGTACCDAQGYDLITLPQGATLGHDGRRMRVFTKPEYRRGAPTPGETEGEHASSDKGGRGGGGRRGGRGGGGRRGMDAGQRTLLEYVARGAGQ